MNSTKGFIQFVLFFSFLPGAPKNTQLKEKLNKLRKRRFLVHLVNEAFYGKKLHIDKYQIHLEVFGVRCIYMYKFHQSSLKKKIVK